MRRQGKENCSRERNHSSFLIRPFLRFVSYLYCAHAALPYLKRTGGSIVVVGSLSGELGLPLRTAYCASKFAVTGLKITREEER